MDTNNIHDRLKLYELALADYEASLGLTRIGKRHKYTDLGFCGYFLSQHNIVVYGCLDLCLPELDKQKPDNSENNHWFRKGDIQPRIDCLKRAIELTKQKITNEANI